MIDLSTIGPCHWRPTFTYDPNEDGTLTPRWTEWWHLADYDGEAVRDIGALIQRKMPAPDWPLPKCAWEGERVRRSRLPLRSEVADPF